MNILTSSWIEFVRKASDCVSEEAVRVCGRKGRRNETKKSRGGETREIIMMKTRRKERRSRESLKVEN